MDVADIWRREALAVRRDPLSSFFVKPFKAQTTATVAPKWPAGTRLQHVSRRRLIIKCNYNDDDWGNLERVKGTSLISLYKSPIKFLYNFLFTFY